MSFQPGDRVIITVQYERVIKDVDCHAGGTDYEFTQPLPPLRGGRVMHTQLKGTKK